MSEKILSAIQAGVIKKQTESPEKGVLEHALSLPETRGLVG